MSAMTYEHAFLRSLYTGESLQQAMRLGSGYDPIPSAFWPEQQRLEDRVFLSLLEFRNVPTLYPLGIRSVSPEPHSISLHVESEERATEILFNVLPAYLPGEELHGIPGLRFSRGGNTSIMLQVLGQRTQVRLTGLPVSTWYRAARKTLDKWVDPSAMRLCWKASRSAWMPAELEHQARWENESDDFVRKEQRGAWLGSGLLRRAGLLHTVANTFLIDGYRGSSSDSRIVLRTSHVPRQGPGPQHIAAALTHPTFGLPMGITRFRGDTDEDYASDQHFTLADQQRTASVEIRGSVERRPSFIKPDLWQAILRRMPQTGFPTTLPPSALAGLSLLP